MPQIDLKNPPIPLALRDALEPSDFIYGDDRNAPLGRDDKDLAWEGELIEGYPVRELTVKQIMKRRKEVKAEMRLDAVVKRELQHVPPAPGAIALYVARVRAARRLRMTPDDMHREFYEGRRPAGLEALAERGFTREAIWGASGLDDEKPHKRKDCHVSDDPDCEWDSKPTSERADPRQSQWAEGSLRQATPTRRRFLQPGSPDDVERQRNADELDEAWRHSGKPGAPVVEPPELEGVDGPDDDDDERPRHRWWHQSERDRSLHDELSRGRQAGLEREAQLVRIAEQMMSGFAANDKVSDGDGKQETVKSIGTDGKVTTLTDSGDEKTYDQAAAQQGLKRESAGHGPPAGPLSWAEPTPGSFNKGDQVANRKTPEQTATVEQDLGNGQVRVTFNGKSVEVPAASLMLSKWPGVKPKAPTPAPSPRMFKPYEIVENLKNPKQLGTVMSEDPAGQWVIVHQNGTNNADVKVHPSSLRGTGKVSSLQRQAGRDEDELLAYYNKLMTVFPPGRGRDSEMEWAWQELHGIDPMKYPMEEPDAVPTEARRVKQAKPGFDPNKVTHAPAGSRALGPRGNVSETGAVVPGGLAFDPHRDRSEVEPDGVLLPEMTTAVVLRWPNLVALAALPKLAEPTWLDGIDRAVARQGGTWTPEATAYELEARFPTAEGAHRFAKHLVTDCYVQAPSVAAKRVDEPGRFMRAGAVRVDMAHRVLMPGGIVFVVEGSLSPGMFTVGENVLVLDAMTSQLSEGKVAAVGPDVAIVATADGSQYEYGRGMLHRVHLARLSLEHVGPEVFPPRQKVVVGRREGTLMACHGDRAQVRFDDGPRWYPREKVDALVRIALLPRFGEASNGPPPGALDRGALAAQANADGAASRTPGAPRLSADSRREDVVRWLQWNDPNGSHLDEHPQAVPSPYEGEEPYMTEPEFPPYTEEGVWEALASMLEDN